ISCTASYIRSKSFDGGRNISVPFRTAAMVVLSVMAHSSVFRATLLRIMHAKAATWQSLSRLDARVDHRKCQQQAGLWWGDGLDKFDTLRPWRFGRVKPLWNFCGRHSLTRRYPYPNSKPWRERWDCLGKVSASRRPNHFVEQRTRSAYDPF